MKNKKGEEMVEAAIVLPILILTILSLILLILHYYHCLHDQTALHGQLQAEAARSKSVAGVLHRNTAVSSKMDGLVEQVLHKEISGRIYLLDHGSILRAGELIGLD